jgi:STE24 endopeptidase
MNVTIAGQMESTILAIIIAILLFDFITDRVLGYLNLKSWSKGFPPGAEGIYDPARYARSREYYIVNYRLSVITSTLSLLLMLALLYFQGFARIDSFVRQHTQQPVCMALLFFGLIGIASDILSTPFSVYRTFVIEEKFGFNRTTARTYIADKIKGYLLAALIGGTLLALVVWIWQHTGEYFWLWVWGVMTVVVVFITMFYASWIVPLFNKLTPLPQGELRTAIEEYCRKVDFRLDDLYIMDGSKRSSKANAFFSGLGAKKRIVLYDTLVEKHTIEELVAVLAHEIGHYKKKHTLAGVILGIFQTGIMLFVMSLFLGNPALSRALGAEQPSFHMSILAFGLLYSPLSQLLGIGMNMLSRKNEYEADRYAAVTYGGAPLGDALKKLSSDSLSNLEPHPAYVFVHYSHPPLLKRLHALEQVR